MKCFVLAVVCLFSVVQAGILTDEQKALITQIYTACLKESGVDEAVALNARKGNYVDDAKLKNQIFCFNKKAGFQNEAGDIQVDVVTSKLKEMVKDVNIDELVQKCNVKKENAEETAFAMAKCFHDFAPNEDFLSV